MPNINKDAWEPGDQDFDLNKPNDLIHMLKSIRNGLLEYSWIEKTLNKAVAFIEAKRPVLVQPEVPVRVIVCSANRYRNTEGGYTLVLGARHCDELMVAQLLHYRKTGLIAEKTWCQGKDQGFIDQWGVYMDRDEGLRVATAAGQIGLHRPKCPGDWLCSEDLY